MPSVRRMRDVRREPAEPAHLQPVRRRNRQGLPRGGPRRETLRVVAADTAQLDSTGTTDRFTQRIWWPVETPLRAAGKQGTPVRFRDGPAAVTRRLRDTDTRYPPRGGRPAAIETISFGTIATPRSSGTAARR